MYKKLQKKKKLRETRTNYIFGVHLIQFNSIEIFIELNCWIEFD